MIISPGMLGLVGPHSGACTPPANITPPTIAAVSGGDVVGATIAASGDAWSGTPTLTPSYSWKRNGSEVGTASTYVLVGADVGQTLSLRKTMTNGCGSAFADSNDITDITSGALLELNNPNGFNVQIGVAGQIVVNTASVGTGTISSPGTNAGGNSGITFF